MRVVLVALGVLAGCDRLLGLSSLELPPPAPRWIAASAGGLHTCAIEADNALYCWGENSEGQLGVGGVFEADAPMQVAGGPWTAVSAGVAHTCALADDGGLWCWGRNQDGETGIGGHGYLAGSPRLEAATGVASEFQTPAPARVDGSWRAVSAGNHFTCAIRDDATLWCWGINSNKNLADPDTTLDRPSPHLASSDAWTSVAAGGYHACGIRDTGELYCWGYGLDGALGVGTRPTNTSTPLAVTAPGVSAWARVAAGNRTTCAIAGSDLSIGGALYCWGAFGGNTPGPIAPAPVMLAGAPFDGVVDVAIGGSDAAPAGPYNDTICALRADGSAWCWDTNPRGQLGPGAAGQAVANEPVQLPADFAPWQAITVGGSHVCMLAGDGTLACLGGDSRNQLGDGGSSHTSPSPVPGVWAQVSAGVDTTCVVDAAGVASCAGAGASGAIGDGGFTDRRSFSAVATTARFATLSAGRQFACALDAAGHPWCWGANSRGQVGDGGGFGKGMIGAPEQISTTVFTTLASYSHTCAIDANQDAWCWGINTRGQTAMNPPADALVPTLLQTSLKWLAIDTGDEHTCGRASDGNAYCWGANAAGQLGTGTSSGTVNPTPTQLQATGGALVALATGGYFSCGLTATGDAYCWGDNHVGQLGIAGLSQQSAPAHIVGHVWRTIAAGQRHACGIDDGGALWCWGDNAFGQVGDGTLVGRDAPVRIGDATSWTAVTCGGNHSCALAGDGTVSCWGRADNGQLGDGLAWRDDLVLVAAP